MIGWLMAVVVTAVFGLSALMLGGMGMYLVIKGPWLDVRFFGVLMLVGALSCALVLSTRLKAAGWVE